MLNLLGPVREVRDPLPQRTEEHAMTVDTSANSSPGEYELPLPQFTRGGDTMNDQELPTEPGSVIGWTSGKVFGGAILSIDPDAGEPQWWRAGFTDSSTPAKLRAQLRLTEWRHVGTITPKGTK